MKEVKYYLGVVSVGGIAFVTVTRLSNWSMMTSQVVRTLSPLLPDLRCLPEYRGYPLAVAIGKLGELDFLRADEGVPQRSNFMGLGTSIAGGSDTRGLCLEA